MIVVCHRCPRRQRPCNGPCACLEDQRDIIHHASASYCPLKLYGDGIAPANWPDVPRVDVTTRATPPTPAPQPDIPVAALTADERKLLGDRIADGIKAVKLDVLAKLWTELTGLPCGCETRKRWLNRLDEWVRGKMRSE